MLETPWLLLPGPQEYDEKATIVSFIQLVQFRFRGFRVGATYCLQSGDTYCSQSGTIHCLQSGAIY
jgi:hypothetical protein